MTVYRIKNIDTGQYAGHALRHWDEKGKVYTTKSAMSNALSHWLRVQQSYARHYHHKQFATNYPSNWVVCAYELTDLHQDTDIPILEFKKPKTKKKAT